METAAPVVGEFATALSVITGESNVNTRTRHPTCWETLNETCLSFPTPIDVVQRTLVDVCHDEVKQTVAPTCAVTVKSESPKLMPRTVSDAPPDVAAFTCSAAVICGLEYEYAAVCVPTRVARVTAAAKDCPAPAADVQVVDVDEDHVVVMQVVSPSRAVGVPSYALPKLLPYSVAVPDPSVGAEVYDVCVTTGALYVKLFNADETRPSMLMNVSHAGPLFRDGKLASVQ